MDDPPNPTRVKPGRTLFQHPHPTLNRNSRGPFIGDVLLAD
jgi:hypothetical protein